MSYPIGMGLGFELFIVILLIVLNGVFAMAELALVSVRRARLAVLERKGVRGAAKARQLAEQPQLFLPTLQVGVTLISIIDGSFGGATLAGHLTPVLADIPYLGRFADELSVGIVVILITYATLVIGELVPKQLAMRGPEAIAARLAPPIAALSRISAPVVWLLSRSSGLVLRLLGSQRAPQQTVTEEELKALLSEGTKAGVLEVEEHNMIERLLRLADKSVRAIMTPRNEVAWVDQTDDREAIAAAVRETIHSRILICDGDVDNVIGIVRSKDLLAQILSNEEWSLKAVMKQPIVVPDTVSALYALERLKADTHGLALVMDEYGSFEGVVTASDVLGAIVGEPENLPLVGEGGKAVDGTIEVDGMMPVDELKERLGLPELPAGGSYHTAGGLVLALLRRVPKAGDKIVFGGWLFEVTRMEGRRVDRIVAHREAPAEKKAEAAASA